MIIDLPELPGEILDYYSIALKKTIQQFHSNEASCYKITHILNFPEHLNSQGEWI